MRKQEQELPSVFLEAHNIRNRNKGLGVFNFQLIKRLVDINDSYRLVINMENKSLMKYFESPYTDFHKYTSLQRHAIFRVKGRYDVWHSLNQNTKIEPFFKTNYVLTIHDVISHNNKKYKKRLEDKIERANAITYISNFVKQETHQYFKIGSHIKEYVIYNGTPLYSVDTSQFNPIEAAQTPFFFAIGDFQERKNFHSLVEMMRLLPDYKLIIAGQNTSPYAESIKTLINRYHLHERVILAGRISDEAKQYYMQHAEAFLFPSTQEGFGLPIVEAMHWGKPVFLSKLTSLPEVGGDVAYYWDNFDPEEMKHRLEEGLSHFQSNKEQTEQKLQARAAFFSWERAAREYLQVYADVLR